MFRGPEVAERGADHWGTVFGVASGYYGGQIDNVMQRIIEIVRSFPAIPLWMALAAAFPPHRSATFAAHTGSGRCSTPCSTTRR